MTDSSGLPPAIPFAPDYRAAGVLLHITSLPSRYGIGDFGPQALAFVDRLVEAGQSWWQTLPLGQPDKGNSPYQSPSTFALNTALISPDRLRDDGLLVDNDLASVSFPDPPSRISSSSPAGSVAALIVSFPPRPLIVS